MMKVCSSLFLASVLVFTVQIGTATAGTARNSLVGSEKCTWGPAYWCSGLQQSAKCRATSHCITKSWNSNPYPEDHDDVCTICKNMVKEARDQLQSNETQVSSITLNGSQLGLGYQQTPEGYERIFPSLFGAGYFWDIIS
jgi:hypothetical protein